MRCFPTLVLALIASATAIQAKPNLLESVKRNPQEAISLCGQFRKLNSQGISAGSKKAINQLSSQQNLSEVDAEILSLYVIGLHCPDVK